jgi:uncharacterized protein YcnI
VRRALALAALGLGAVAPAASAHVQVTPARVAPGDAVMFTVLVPNERDTATTKVALKIPDGVLAFSFEEEPGWTRTEQQAANGSVESVTWTGSLPPESFVRFTFLASTPDTQGTLAFPAVQTYADGQEAAWIGAPDSQEPAPTVEVTTAAPSANAGGEGDEGGGAESAATTAPATTAAEPATSAAATEPAEPAATTAAAPGAEEEADDGDDPSAATWVALTLAIIALVAGLAALGVALRRRREPVDRPSDPDAF